MRGMLRIFTAYLRLDGRIQSDDEVLFVVMSKNRPAQLDALLRSLRRHVKGHWRVHVLVKADSLFSSATQEVLTAAKIQRLDVTFESDFRDDLLNILKGGKEKIVIFCVDDLIFVRPFDLESLSGLNLKRVVPSLRLWPGVVYCQPAGISTPPPRLRTKPGSDWLSFSWTASRGDWAMPLSLDGSVFLRQEILALAQALNFQAPNSLEFALGGYRFWFKHRTGLCRERAVLLNFALNRVQSEDFDFPAGDETVEQMLEQWEQGWQLDIHRLSATVAKSCHVICNPLWERKERPPPAL